MDKLDVVSKWIVIPKFITGQAIDSGSNGISLLRKLVTSRNKLVHYKAGKTNIREYFVRLDKIRDSENIGRLPWIEVAENGVAAFEQLINELKKIDKELADAEFDWDEDDDLWFQILGE